MCEFQTRHATQGGLFLSAISDAGWRQLQREFYRCTKGLAEIEPLFGPPESGIDDSDPDITLPRRPSLIKESDADRRAVARFMIYVTDHADYLDSRPVPARMTGEVNSLSSASWQQLAQIASGLYQLQQQ